MSFMHLRGTLVHGRQSALAGDASASGEDPDSYTNDEQRALKQILEGGVRTRNGHGIEGHTHCEHSDERADNVELPVP